MATETALLESIRRWLLAAVLAGGTLIFTLATVGSGVAPARTDVFAIVRLVGLLLMAAPLFALVDELPAILGRE